MTRFPRILIVTDRRISYRPLAEQIARALDGVRATELSLAGVVFRDRDLDPTSRRRLAGAVARVAFSGGSPLLVGTGGSGDGGVEIAREVRADGVHLSSEGSILPRAWRVLGRSCHSEADLYRAALEGMDYVTVSPVFDSISKSGRGGPGSGVISRLLSAPGPRPLPPVFALGGVVPELAGECIQAGAYGVAVCGALMTSPDPAGVAQRLAWEIARALERRDG